MITNFIQDIYLKLYQKFLLKTAIKYLVTMIGLLNIYFMILFISYKNETSKDMNDNTYVIS